MNAQAIQSTVILVRFANRAQDGKPPSICSSDGTFYGVKPADFGRFQPGGRYRIEYTEKQGRGKWEGRTFRDILKCEPEALPASARVTAPSDQQAPGSREPNLAESDFVSRCLAASIAACSVGRSKDELVERVRLLREVYRSTFT